MSSPLKTIAVIQARMSSSRLPGKVLRDIAGQPMLARVVERARRAVRVDEVIVATTLDSADDAVAEFCSGRGYPFYRGSLNDVLDRYYQAARLYSAEIIVRLTADCPLADPDLIDHTVEAFLGKAPSGDQLQRDDPPYDFAANRLPPPWGRTYPIGLDTEVCMFSALERAWQEADQPYQREHVMPYLYEDSEVIDSLTGRVIDGPKQVFARRHPFRVLLVNHPVDYGALRWTVDTPQDLEVVQQIFARFGGRDDFSWLEVLELYQKEPDFARLNAAVRHKTAFDVDERQQLDDR
jgi:spore coat polysaccharide biosynthesis protein SpsF